MCVCVCQRHRQIHLERNGRECVSVSERQTGTLRERGERVCVCVCQRDRQIQLEREGKESLCVCVRETDRYT